MANVDITSPERSSSVFSTFELLERILIDVDSKTLLLSQRVNRIWSEVISRSTSLQKKLYFLPATFEQAERFIFPANEEAIIAIPNFATWGWRRFARTTPIQIRSDVEQEISRVVSLNPLLFPAICQGSPRYVIPRTARERVGTNSSWRRMRCAHPGLSARALHAVFERKKLGEPYIHRFKDGQWTQPCSCPGYRLCRCPKEEDIEAPLITDEVRRKIRQLQRRSASTNAVDSTKSYVVVSATWITHVECKMAREQTLEYCDPSTGRNALDGFQLLF